LAWVFRYSWDNWIQPPSIEYPRRIDLGDREWGELAVGRFTIANRGSGELVLDQFYTSCSCAGVELEQDGKRQRVEALRLPPGGVIELSVRVAVGGVPGDRQHVHVVFATNDPARRSGAIELSIPQVKYGVAFLPRVVLLGQVRVGTSARQLIGLYDGRQPGRRIASVRSLQPDRFEARLLPISHQEESRIDIRAGRMIAMLEVVGQTSKPGPLAGSIEVTLDRESRRPDYIAVLGEVVTDVACTPIALVLPRRCTGKDLHSGQLVLRHRDDKPIHVEIESLSPGLSARVQPTSGNELDRVVELDCAKVRDVSGSPSVVRLGIRAGSEKNVLEVPIYVTSPPSGSVKESKEVP
jgi:hypothetical protein